MADNFQGTTVPMFFFSCNSDQTNLFGVQPGVSVLNALQMVSSFLSVARDSAYQAGDAGSGSCGYAAGHLITMAKAVVDSVVEGIEFPCGDNRPMQDVLRRMFCLVDERILVINPHAEQFAKEDAEQFILWAEQKLKGGAL